MFNKQRLLTGTGRAVLKGGVFAAAIAIALVSLGGEVLAQEKAGGKAAKGDQPKQPPSTWVKICNHPKDGQKKGCITRSDIIEHEVMQVYGIVGVESVEGEAKTSLIATLPYAVITPRKVKNPKTNEEVTVPATLQFTWNVSGTVRAKIDDSSEIKMKMLYCYRVGCVASADIGADIVGKLKKGKEIAVIGQTFGRGGTAGRDIPLPVSLNGFAAAFDGQPVDNKKYETFWGREIARRNLAKLDMQNKMLKKLQEQQQAEKGKAANEKKK